MRLEVGAAHPNDHGYVLLDLGDIAPMSFPRWIAPALPESNIGG